MPEHTTLTTTSGHRIQILARGSTLTARVAGKPFAVDGVYDLIGGGRIQVAGGHIVRTPGLEVPEAR